MFCFMFESELYNGTSRITKVGEPKEVPRLKINRAEAIGSAALFIRVLLPVVKCRHSPYTMMQRKLHGRWGGGADATGLQEP